MLSATLGAREVRFGGAAAGGSAVDPGPGDVDLGLS